MKEYVIAIMPNTGGRRPVGYVSALSQRGGRVTDFSVGEHRGNGICWDDRDDAEYVARKFDRFCLNVEVRS